VEGPSHNIPLTDRDDVPVNRLQQDINRPNNINSGKRVLSPRRAMNGEATEFDARNSTENSTLADREQKRNKH
jgi:hypothetical protein